MNIGLQGFTAMFAMSSPDRCLSAFVRAFIRACFLLIVLRPKQFVTNWTFFVFDPARPRIPAFRRTKVTGRIAFTDKLFATIDACRYPTLAQVGTVLLSRALGFESLTACCALLLA